MTIALLLLPYGAFLLVWFALSAFAIYHLVKFGVQNFTTFLATFLYITASTLILFFSFTLLAQINWAIPLFPGFSIFPS